MNELNVPHEKKKKSDLLYFAVIVILLLSNIFFAYKFFTMRKDKVFVEVELKEKSNEKEKLQQELETMLADYDNLQTDNKKISAELEEEKEKIKEMLEEIKKIKSANSYQISQYKKELNVLREIMRSYIVQIDSLNTRNKILAEENKQVKTDYHKIKNEKDQLEQKTETLSSKVSVAETLRAMNISALGINEKGKEVGKSKRTEKIKVCFTLAENAIAKAGNRTIFLRIARPDKIILANPENAYFTFDEQDILYSARRDIDYQNQDIDMCIYWNNDGTLITGVYTIDLYSDGKKIGTTTFALK
jgi:predicted nuclease with TOPRIM domain